MLVSYYKFDPKKMGAHSRTTGGFEEARGHIPLARPIFTDLDWEMLMLDL